MNVQNKHRCYYKMISKLLAILDMLLDWDFKVKIFLEMPPLKNDINYISIQVLGWICVFLPF